MRSIALACSHAKKIRTLLKKKYLTYLVGKTARAYVAAFDKAINKIVKIDMTCTNYLLDIGLKHWAITHFTGDCFNYITSNIAKSWNAVLREARGFPRTSLVEYIRSTLMTWFLCRKEAAEAETNSVTPKVQKMLADICLRSQQDLVF